jgi:prepilin-type N-terminal cleavage/methylation domain-containing protein
VRRLRQRLAQEGGYSLVELVVTMAILGTVMGGLTTVFVAGGKAQQNLNSRFQAQSQARVALDKLRREVHNACTIQTQSATSVTFLFQPTCSSNAVTWCTRASTNFSGYALYRVPGTTCTDGQLFADALTSDSIFTYTAQNTPAGSYALARLHVDFTINVEPAKAYTRYRLVDDIAFRNSPRS